VQQLAAAVHQFGIDPQAPPIPETARKLSQIAQRAALETPQILLGTVKTSQLRSFNRTASMYGMPDLPRS